MKNISEIAQWVIDNRYPKSEYDKISDSEMYHTLVDKMGEVLKHDSVRNNLREIEAYSSNSIYELDYKKRYWFHQWIDETDALVEDEEGILLNAKHTEFRFKIIEDLNE